MFQTFETVSQPETGAPRLADLRGALQDAGLSGFLVPRADMYRGEYVAPHDDRLAWLTGFTGSAGFCAVLPERAGVFIDGRYRVQVKSQIDLAAYDPVPWPETKLQDWLIENLPDGGEVGFDPWLHSFSEVDTMVAPLRDAGIRLVSGPNFVDRIWADQPAPPMGLITAHPDDLAGESSASKRARLAEVLSHAGQSSAVITLPDSIAWLLNIRGRDIARNPVPHCLAILHADETVDLFAHPDKIDEDLRAHLGEDIRIAPMDAFDGALRALNGPVRLDRDNAPFRLTEILNEAGIVFEWGADPCILPKAQKTAAEIEGARTAHIRDGAAMVEFLTWLDATAPSGTLTEIDVVTELECCRRATNRLKDISFETIAGSGPNGAIVHYRVTRDTNRPVNTGEMLLIDSGGQYVDGTTDITRTVAVGDVGADERRCFTRVLQGMIGISRLQWPVGLAGRDLDAIARAPLWMDGLDYNHGTGHGVGSYLCVHEGPQRLSRISEQPLLPGMILSNEPGYYREGAFGIRIENLIVVTPAPEGAVEDGRSMLCFETLTYVPIDRRLIEVDLLSKAEIAWIDSYHAEVLSRIGSHVSGPARTWLQEACAPL